MQPRRDVLSHFPTQWQRFVKASASSTHEGNVQEINQGKMKGEDVMNFYNEIIQADAQTVKQEAKVEVKEENEANDAKSKQFFNISLDEDDDVIRYTARPPSPSLGHRNAFQHHINIVGLLWLRCLAQKMVIS